MWGCIRRKEKSFPIIPLENEATGLVLPPPLCTSRRLLILDEPINGLDPIGIVEIRSFLSELSHNHGITIFISSHVLSEIEQIADIIGVMHEGHLVEEVNISELHKRNRKYIQFDLSDSEIAGKIFRKPLPHDGFYSAGRYGENL